MSRYMNLRVKTEKAIRLTACMRDFGDYMGKWKEAIYELSCYNADMHLRIASKCAITTTITKLWP